MNTMMLFSLFWLPHVTCIPRRRVDLDFACAKIFMIGEWSPLHKKKQIEQLKKKNEHMPQSRELKNKKSEGDKHSRGPPGSGVKKGMKSPY